MSYQLVKFGKQLLQLHSNKSLYWEAEELLVVSDLHLEKGSSFNSSGQFLPPYDTKETINRLASIIAGIKPKTLILLGDTFHDNSSFERMHSKDKANFNKIITQIDTIFIEGNHDSKISKFNFRNEKCYKRKNLIFRHIFTKNPNNYEVTGHYHPTVKLMHRGIKFRSPCYVVNNKKIVLPSFGKYTGGIDIKNNTFSFLKKSKTFIFIVSEKKITKINHK